MEQKINKRFVAHINEGYLQRLYLQQKADTQEKKVELQNKVIDEIRKFVRGESEDNTLITYDFTDQSGETRSTWWLEFIDREEEDDRLTEKQIYNDYQERSVTAGNRAEQLAWAFVVILCAQLVGGEHFKEPYVIAAGGICYMLLSALQSLWQAFSMWVFKQKVKRNNLMVSDYPNTIGGIAWAFYWAKMLVIAVTAVYAVIKFVQLL